MEKAEEPKDLKDLKTDDRLPRPNVIYRGGWGALPPKEQVPLTHPVSKIIYTYTRTKECNTTEECTDAMKKLQIRDMNSRGMPDIQYNFIIGGDEHVYEGRGWHIKPTNDPENAHLDGKTIIIAYIGDFRDKDPSTQLLKIGYVILNDALTKKYITPILDVKPARKGHLDKFDKLDFSEKKPLHIH